MHNPFADTAVEPLGPDFGSLFFAGSEPDLQLSFGAASHVGRVRTQNEDHFAILRMRRSLEVMHASLTSEELAVPESSSYAIVVADGIGGAKSGELASRMALQTMLELVGQATSWVMRLTDRDAQQIDQRVNAYVSRIHQALSEHGQRNQADAKMGTTWTSAHLYGRQAVIVHLGDSRAYLHRCGELVQITRDQTMEQLLVDRGLPPQLVRNFRHVLLNSLGGGKGEARATLHHFDLMPGDRLLLCSDGLSGMMRDEDIVAELAATFDSQSVCDALIRRALANGGHDNITVVLATVSSAVDHSRLVAE